MKKSKKIMTILLVILMSLTSFLPQRRVYAENEGNDAFTYSFVSELNEDSTMANITLQLQANKEYKINEILMPDGTQSVYKGETISYVAKENGELKFIIKYQLDTQDLESEIQEKTISFIVDNIVQQGSMKMDETYVENDLAEVDEESMVVTEDDIDSNLAKADEQSIAINEEAMVLSDEAFTVEFYLLTFNGTGLFKVKTKLIETKSVVNGELATPPVMSQVGSTLSNWYTEYSTTAKSAEDFISKATPRTLYDFNKTPVSKNLKVYACWIEGAPKYTVLFKDQLDIISTQANLENGDFLVEPTAPQKAGYLFIGWKSPNGFYDFTQPLNESTLYNVNKKTTIIGGLNIKEVKNTRILEAVYEPDPTSQGSKYQENIINYYPVSKKMFREFVYFGQYDGKPQRWQYNGAIKAGVNESGGINLYATSLMGTSSFGNVSNYDESDIRVYLNDSLFKNAFTTNEQKTISPTIIKQQEDVTSTILALHSEFFIHKGYTSSGVNGDLLYIPNSRVLGDTFYTLPGKRGGAEARIAPADFVEEPYWTSSTFIDSADGFGNPLKTVVINPNTPVAYEMTLNEGLKSSDVGLTLSKGRMKVNERIMMPSDASQIYGVRPATNLSDDKLLFVSSANEIKATNKNQWISVSNPDSYSITGDLVGSKLTYQDDDLKLNITNISPVYKDEGVKDELFDWDCSLKISFDYEAIGNVQDLCVFVTNPENGDLLIYKELKDLTVDKNGKVELYVPSNTVLDLGKGLSKMYIYAKQDNGIGKTDFTSNLVEIPVKYTVHYDTNGFGKLESKTDINFNGDHLLPDAFFSQEGYYTPVWKYNDIVVSDEIKYSDLAKDFFQTEVTLTLGWIEKKDYTVVYNPNGGDMLNGFPSTLTNLPYSSVIPLPTPTLGNKLFMGWTYQEQYVGENSTYGSLVNNDSIKQIELIAKWYEPSVDPDPDNPNLYRLDITMDNIVKPLGFKPDIYDYTVVLKTVGDIRVTPIVENPKATTKVYLSSRQRPNKIEIPILDNKKDYLISKEKLRPDDIYMVYVEVTSEYGKEKALYTIKFKIGEIIYAVTDKDGKQAPPIPTVVKDLEDDSYFTDIPTNYYGELQLRVDDTPVVPENDVLLVEQAIKENGRLKLGQYIDLSLFRLVTNEKNILVNEDKLSTSRKTLQITLPIPPHLLNKKRIIVIRIHDGTTDILEDQDNNPDTYTINTDKFSTYAFAYQDTYMIDYEFVPGQRPNDIVVPNKEVVDAGTSINRPMLIIPDGWIFDGWYLEKECLQKFDFNTPINADLKLYGKWTLQGVNTPNTSDKTKLNEILMLLVFSAGILFVLKKRNYEQS